MEKNSQAQSKLHSKPVPIFWWMHRWVDIRFIIRELTSVFVAGYSVILLFYIRSIRQGPEAFARLSERFTSPLWIALHCFALVALVYHSITWFNLAPKAMVVKLGATRIPNVVIVLMNYGGWVSISIVLIWLVLNG
jgi:fumarate reductase subunit C